jgi:putative transposase
MSIDELRAAFRYVKERHPFRIEAIVILPEHLHCILTLPPDDAEFAIRWNLIKGMFSRSIEHGERCSKSRIKRGERGLWQRRFWEHVIRDEEDLIKHIDYIHWNPVKHMWVKNVGDWPHSSFHSFVARGVYPENWGHEGKFEIRAGE